MTMVGPVVKPFLEAPWLTYTASEPSSYATEVGFPEALRHATEYPLEPGVILDFMADETPAGVIRQDFVIPETGQNIYIYRSANPSRPDDPRTIFYMHGGGFVRGNGGYARSMALWHLRETGLPTVAVEYHLAPEYKWPTSLNDVFAAWNYLINELGYDPHQFIISGDSSGGSLAAGLVMRLKLRELPQATQLIIMSGVMDFAYTLPSHQANAEIDLLFRGGIDPASIVIIADAKDAKNPEFSVYYGDLSGFPPTYLVAGENEIFLSDTLETAQKMYEQGVAVSAHIFHGMWHDWVTDDCENLPESDVVGEDFRQFLGLD